MKSVALSKSEKKSRLKLLLGIFFVLPAFIYHFVVVMLPSFQTLYLSLYDWNGIAPPKYIGMANFVEIFTKDMVFRTALKNNLVWICIFITVPIILGLLVAICVSGVKNNKTQMFYRTVYFMPYVLSAAIAGKIWANFYNPYYGFTTVFKALGLDGLSEVLWLGEPNIALFSVAFVSNWHWWGFVMVLFIAALQQIDPALYEAATVDGCGRLKSFWHITLPGISPTFVFIVMLSLMWSVLSFDFIWVMTMGGPGQATEMLSTWIYKNAFVNYRAGYANAMCIIQSLIVLGIFVINQIVKRKVEEIN